MSPSGIADVIGPRVLHVEVTQEDIDRGEPVEALCCPVAHALRRAGAPHPMVLRGNCLLDSESNRPDRRWIELPEEVARFVMRFDNGHDVAPFAFDLEVG